MTSDDYWVFLTYLHTLIRYFTTHAYLVKSDAAWPTYIKIWRHMGMLQFSLGTIQILRNQKGESVDGRGQTLAFSYMVKKSGVFKNIT